MTESKFSQWWKDNPDKAEGIRRRRREKYNSDAEFRESERARKRKRKRPAKRLPKPRVFHGDDGIPFVVVSVGVVAQTLGAHKRTIANLESSGAIPTNRVVDHLGRRWWPKEWIEWLKPFFRAKNNKEIPFNEFTTRVWNDWVKALANPMFPVVQAPKQGSDETSKTQLDNEDDVIISPTIVRVKRTVKINGGEEDSDLETEDIIEVNKFVTQPAVVHFYFPMKRALEFQSVGLEIGVDLPCYVEEMDAAFERAKEIVGERMRQYLPEANKVLDSLVELKRASGSR